MSVVILRVPSLVFRGGPCLSYAMFAISVTATGLAGCRLQVYEATTCKFLEPCLDFTAIQKTAHHTCAGFDSRDCIFCNKVNMYSMQCHLLGLFIHLFMIVWSKLKRSTVKTLC